MQEIVVLFLKTANRVLIPNVECHQILHNTVGFCMEAYVIVFFLNIYTALCTSRGHQFSLDSVHKPRILALSCAAQYHGQKAFPDHLLLFTLSSCSCKTTRNRSLEPLATANDKTRVKKTLLSGNPTGTVRKSLKCTSITSQHNSNLYR